MGLSDSLSIYREETDELVNLQLIIEEPQVKYQSLDRIMGFGNANISSGYGYRLVRYNPTETFFELYAPLIVSVNSYTAEVVTSRFWGQTATTWLLDLHTRFRLARFGWKAAGILGLLLIVSCGTGLYLWWPGIKEIRQAFQVRHHASMMQLAFDLHRLSGLLSEVALLVLAVTGFFLSYPSVLETLTG